MTTDERLTRIEHMLSQLIEQTAPARPASDEKIFRDLGPKYWNGEAFAGRQMSETTPEFLQAFAKYKGACVYMAKKENDPEKAKYIGRDEQSAKLAMDWATYLERRGAKVAPAPTTRPHLAPAPVSDDSDDGLLPF